MDARDEWRIVPAAWFLLGCRPFDLAQLNRHRAPSRRDVRV
jgi:hypothetical protein